MVQEAAPTVQIFSSKFSENNKHIGFIDVLLLLLFSLWFVEIKIVGRLFLVEVVFFLIALWIFLTDFRSKILSAPLIKRVLILWVCWFLAQIFTDIYREAPFSDYIRGWAKIFFFGTNLIALYALIKDNERRLVLFVIGMAIGVLLKTIFFPNVYFLGGSIWKFGYAGPVLIFFILGSTRLKNRYFPAILLIAFGILNLFFDARGSALGCMGAATAIFLANFYRFAKKKYSLERKLIPKTPVAVIIIVVMAATLWFFYGLSGRYHIGIDVGQRQMTETERNPLYGRLGIVAGLKAAIDSPVIGHGSWARDIEYVFFLADLRSWIGLKGVMFRSDLIPSHSYLVGAWVEAGIFGLIFWLFVFYQAIKGFFCLILLNPQLIPILALILIGFLWSLWFSPFGAQARIVAAFNIVIVQFILNRWMLAEKKYSP